MARTICVAAGLVGALMTTAAAATATTGATEQAPSAVAQPSATTVVSPLSWGAWLDCPPNDAGGTGSVGWELTTASATSGKLDDIVRLRFSSECPGVTHAMTFDVWSDPALVVTAEIDFVGPVDVTLSQTDLRALGLGSFQGGASMWGGAALVNVAPQTRDPRPVLGTFGPRTPIQG